MSDIRYISLSDTHFGEEDDLLTNVKKGTGQIDPTKPSPVLEQLVECLRYIIDKKTKAKKPTLILNGDILELALCTTDQAAMAFERFIELSMKDGEELFDEIIYIPGNHDHHLWETARETQYINHVKKVKIRRKLEPPRHTTNLFPENQKIKVPSVFLTNLMHRFDHLRKQDKKIIVFYPNLGLKSADGKKCVVFTHGHYIEPLYKLMTTLKRMIFPEQKSPRRINEIEAENFAWIDFFWSTMGRSGQVGRDVEIIYEKLQYALGLKSILKNLAKSLAERFDLPGWGDRMETKIANAALQKLLRDAGKRERSDTGSALGFEGEMGLRNYVTGPLRNQILEEIGTMPEDVTIVFGHTHKAFQKDMQNFEGYSRWVNLYNTGGWVVETIDPEPIHGGAVVLIDKDLNATSLRMYDEAGDPNQYMVRVEEARHGGEKSNPFHEEVTKLVDPYQDPWKSFSETVAASVQERAKNLKRRVKGRKYVD